MSARTTTLRRAALTALAAPMALGLALAGSATTGQAHEGVWVNKEWRATSTCWCELPDEYDGTYFQHDSGGMAYKVRMYDHTDQLIGKVEFHPQGEKVWVYDTLANDDALYVHVSWTDKNGRDKVTYIKVPSGDRYTVADLNIAEGTTVTIKVYDDGWGKGHITTGTAVA